MNPLGLPQPGGGPAACPNDCGGHGICTPKGCVCDRYYLGEACGANVRAAVGVRAFDTFLFVTVGVHGLVLVLTWLYWTDRLCHRFSRPRSRTLSALTARDGANLLNALACLLRILYLTDPLDAATLASTVSENVLLRFPQVLWLVAFNFVLLVWWDIIASVSRVRPSAGWRLSMFVGGVVFLIVATTLSALDALLPGAARRSVSTGAGDPYSLAIDMMMVVVLVGFAGVGVVSSWRLWHVSAVLRASTGPVGGAGAGAGSVDVEAESGASKGTGDGESVDRLTQASPPQTGHWMHAGLSRQVAPAVGSGDGAPPEGVQLQAAAARNVQRALAVVRDALFSIVVSTVLSLAVVAAIATVHLAAIGPQNHPTGYFAYMVLIHAGFEGFTALMLLRLSTQHKTPAMQRRLRASCGAVCGVARAVCVEACCVCSAPPAPAPSSGSGAGPLLARGDARERLLGSGQDSDSVASGGGMSATTQQYLAAASEARGVAHGMRRAFRNEDDGVDAARTPPAANPAPRGPKQAPKTPLSALPVLSDTRIRAPGAAASITSDDEALPPGHVPTHRGGPEPLSLQQGSAARAVPSRATAWRRDGDRDGVGAAQDHPLGATLGGGGGGGAESMLGSFRPQEWVRAAADWASTGHSEDGDVVRSVLYGVDDHEDAPHAPPRRPQSERGQDAEPPPAWLGSLPPARLVPPPRLPPRGASDS